MAALEILVPTPAIRNLIREDKLHQVYSAMQSGQEKIGMQTMNQALATLHQKRQITLQQAMSYSSNRDELQDMINRGAGGRGGRWPRTDRPSSAGCRDAAIVDVNPIEG